MVRRVLGAFAICLVGATAAAQTADEHFRYAVIGWYSDDTSASASDTVLRSLVDHLKTVGYSGITFQITVDVSAGGQVLNSRPQQRVWQWVDYARQRGLGVALQVNWSAGSNIALDVNDTPASFSVPLFLQGVGQYFNVLAPVAQAHGIATLYLGYHSDNLVASKYHAEWAAIISNLRAAFTGKISYIGWYHDATASTRQQNAAFKDIGLWDLVDLIAVELHFTYPQMPLYDIAQIQAGYFYRTNSESNVVADLVGLARTYRKPLVFGSLFFMNLDNALDGNDPTAAQAQATPLPLNPTAQTAAYQAALELIGKNLASFVAGINFSLYEPWVYTTFTPSGSFSAADAATLNAFKSTGALAGPTTDFPGTAAERLISQYLQQPWGYHTTTATLGGPGNDIIYVNGGNNLVTPNGGQDEINGTGGDDTVVLPGNSAGYTVLTTATGYRVTDNAKPANVATLTNIAKLQFDDRLVVLSPGRLINMAILTPLASGETMTMGTVLGGAGTSGTKPLLVRAAGPALLQFGVTGCLPDPTMTLNYTSPTPVVVLATNDNWGGTAALSAAFTSVGAFPYTSTNSTDAALFQSGASALAPGKYTVQVSDTGSGSGWVIAEIYDANGSAYTLTTPRLINVSVLKQIDAGATLTAGFVIGGSAARSVLIRAIGPGLTQFGVGGVMPDPQLTLNNISVSPAVVVATNNDWAGAAAIVAAATSVGAFAVSDTASKDAMLLVTLAPGNYTAQVSPASGSAGGFVIVEVYEVP